MVTPSNTGSSTVGLQPGLDPLDQELGKDDVSDILGNYLEEQQSAVHDLIRANPGLTKSESPEAMDVNFTLPLEVITEHPLLPIADTQDQAMETKPPETSPRTFQPELGMPGYTLSLIGSANMLPSQITIEDNALLDADLDALGLSQSKAPGTRQPEGSLKSKMTLW